MRAGAVLLALLLLTSLVQAQNSLDGVLVQMLNQPREQWELILNRNKSSLKTEDVIPAIKRSMMLAVKGQDKEAAANMRAIDFVDWYLGGKTEFRGLGELTLATYFLQQHVPAKASPVLEAMLEAHPECSDAWVLQGHVYMESDPLRSIDMFKKAVAANPNSEGAYLGLGQAFFLVGKNKEAIAAYQKAIEINPDNGMARDAVKYLENPKAAQAQLARTEEGNRHFLMAEELYSRGKYLEAIKEYDLAIKADERFFKAWTYKGDAYYQLGQLEKATACYRQAAKGDPKDKQAWRKLGDALERRYNQSADKKLLDEAIASYQKSLSLDPNYGAAQDDLARALKLRDQSAGNVPVKTSDPGPATSPSPEPTSGQ